ncbi:MAG TPA: NosD domain-containing protein [Candidatus Limnocylindrales bacterium]|nr:NosD domain-containing protein [Candidatus Limnocylindrales bacterium]
MNNLSNNENLYLFSWDDIPGNDNLRLIKIIGNLFRIEWAETAIIEKIDGGKTIKVSTEKNSLLLKLNDEKTRVDLTINDGRTDEFIAMMNNSKLNIYKNIGGKAGLFSRNANRSGPITGNAYFVHEPQISSDSNITLKRGAVQVQALSSLNPQTNYYTTILRSKKPKNKFDITSLRSEHKSGELLVKYTKKLPKKDLENFYKSQNMTLIKDYPGIGYHLIRVDESRLENAMEGLSVSDKFEDAEPNYRVKALKTPNDPRFNELWGMNNTGQTGGTPDADIDAPQAWDISTGSKEVIVAVIDTGVDHTHEDLAGNMWANPGEIPGNGLDDDKNGFIDDYYGWDFAYKDNDPIDGDSHGTHVSGTIGGVGNNGKGVAGVSWNVRIMAVKFLDDSGSGYDSDAIDAINYATMMGADIMSNSWGGGGYSSALEAAIQAADNAGILFIAAAGNDADNTDQYPFYPAGYDVPNVMSIAATDKNDNLADFSNYGHSTVDIGAPGVDILSSVPGNAYASYSGTSMAAPHVSGAAALLKAFNPSLTHLEIKDILMNSVDPLPSLYGKTATGGRLNIQKAITFGLTYSTVCQSGCDYPSIQTAINAANPGNTILVRSGIYYENVNVTKQLKLRGIGMPVVDARGSRSAITLTADGIILEGFTATGGASYPEAGIKVISNNNTLRDNNVLNNSYAGIVLESSRNNTLIRNNASNNNGIGIYLNKSGNNTLSANNVSNNINGIRLDSSNNNTLNSNNANSNNEFGITLRSSRTNKIYNNIFNNANNVQFVGSNTGTWNTTRQIGTNIIGGSYLAGNFWANPDGTGFSQMCEDSNKDGICDLVHPLDSTNIDYLALSTTKTPTAVYNINKSTHYITIQAAIDDANHGDEILVGSGTYYENVNVSKMLTLRGIGMPVVNAGGNGSAITLAADGNILVGFTATGGGAYEAGIKVISNNNTLSGNKAYGNGYSGIHLFSSSSNTLNGNIASNNGDILDGYGILLSSSNNNTLIDNNANANSGKCYVYMMPSGECPPDDYRIGIGILLSSSSNNTLSGNNANSNSGESAGYEIASGEGLGIFLSSSNNNTLVGNNANSNWGLGFAWSGQGYGYGILLSSSNNNTLAGNNANSNSGEGDGDGMGSGGFGSGYGILLFSSSNNALRGNSANVNSGEGYGSCCGEGYGYGISLSSSSNNMLNGNIANSNSGECWGGGYTSCEGHGISLFSSSKSNLIKNMMEGNNYNFGLEGSSYLDFDNKIDISNLVSGKPVYYIKGATNTVYDSDTNAGTFYCISCVNVTLKNLDLKANTKGILLWNTTRSKIQNVTASDNVIGISLESSRNNILSGNNAKGNGISGNGAGISLSSSGNNMLINNDASNNSDWWSGSTGIFLSSSSNNTLITNNANGNTDGIALSSSSGNTLSGNSANSNNYAGINLDDSSNNILISNKVSNSGYNSLWYSNNNTIFNNIFYNTDLYVDYSNRNTWNTTRQSGTNIISGSNLGGNFWAKPDGTGFSQTCEDSNRDDICDSFYTLDSTNIDYLPLAIRKPVHNINKSTHYITIQAAINDASPGNEIHVDSGTYFENVNVNKQLNLRGIGMPVVVANGSGSAITLSANGSILEGFTATGAGSNTGAGINVISNNNTVRANNATSNSLGIYLYSSDFNNVTGNNISNSTSVGIKVSDTSTNNTVSRNKITNSTSGMFFVYAFNITASNNIMENNSFNFGVGGNILSHFEGNTIDTTNLANGRPIYYVKHGKNTTYDGSTKASTFYCILCNNVTVKDLEMSNMDKGVYFWETNNARIQHITVKQSGWGIFLRNSSNNSIRDSKFSTNNLQDYFERGVTIYSSYDNTLTNNTFISNNYGLELFSSSRNTIYNNYFNNTNNFLFSGSMLKNTWNISKNPGTNIVGGSYLGGNFWANSTGKDFSQICLDSNNDGLCDMKYMLNSNNSDYLPLKYQSVPPRITVVFPNDGENWTRGTTQTIRWTGSSGGYVKIELMKAGVWKSNIILSTPNDGSHPWLIPVTQIPGTDYKIRITSTTNAANTDTSDNTFTIPTPNISVITPKGGDTWRRGTTQTIKWNSSGSPGAYVKIELIKAGVANRVIIAITPNDGTHPWLIPATQAPGTDYKVRITSTTNAAYNDTSDNSFTIPAPSFTVVSPNGPENWTHGTTQTIRWNSTESPRSYIKIELLKPGVVPNKVIIASTLNDGSHPWLIPGTQATGDDYKVKITSTITASNNDTSDSNFSVN